MLEPIKTQEHFEEDVRSDKLQLLYHQSHHAVFFSVVGAALYVIIFWTHVSHDFLLAWLAAIVFASLIRIILFYRYRKQQLSGKDILHWEKPYFISLIFSSFIWGGGLALLGYTTSFLYQSIAYFLLMVMAGSALTVYSAIRYMSISVVVIILMPMTILFLFLGEHTSVLMAVAGLLFMASAARSTRVLSESLDFSYMLTHALTRAKEEAEKLASTDILTGINNRRAFTELAKAQLQYCERHELPVSAIILDADHFKKINDTLGHAAGDIALQHLAQILKKTTRATDIVGRIGGEEFAILFTNTRINEAILIAEKIKNWIADNPVHVAEEYFSITVSIGVSSGDNYNLDLLLNHADKAMYKAKKEGRNQVKYYASEEYK